MGALSMLVPMYNAELAPPGIRGSLVALQQLAITCKSQPVFRPRDDSAKKALAKSTVGILVSYWIAYGTNYIGGTEYPGQSQAAWRVPLGLQLVPGVILCVGVYWLPFSPRWLMLRGASWGCALNEGCD